MNKLTMILVAMLALFAVGCASGGGGAMSDAMHDTMHDGGLPEIAPYDEVAVEPMPAFVPAE